MQVELSKEEMDLIERSIDQVDDLKRDAEDTSLWAKIKDKFKQRQEVQKAAEEGFKS